MKLRIIAGELGGRRIDAPPGRITRPTREAVREAWFSAIGARIPGSRVLDLFAGSGALGIEALSRGASHVTFIESNRKICRVLAANLRRLNIEDRTTMLCTDAIGVVESAARAGRREWDIVLADPPYAGEAAARLAEAFDRFAFAGILCVEHAPGVEVSRAPDWQKRYGETALSFFVDPAELTDPAGGASGHE